MKPQITTLLFDMDNTLFDLVSAQITACRAVAEYLGQPGADDLFEKYFMSDYRGFESHENILDYLKDRQMPVEIQYHGACRIYEEVKLAHIIPYDGITAALSKFRNQGFHMAIITDAYSRDATRRLEHSGLLPFFDGIVAYDMVMVKKPAREPFLLALEMMNAGADETILIGDSPHRDIRPAREMGIRTIYARYGDRFSGVRECHDADFIVNHPDELISVIEGYLR